ncbi:MAG: LD-carboxypeptidase [Paludibacteraceae bacterium]|nr:LD-carboxypeptidase [Paludibacteraceae bacterium]
MKHIRIISPSGIIDPIYIDQAAARLRSWGYETSEGTHARDKWGRFAGTDAERVQDIIVALEDPAVDFILCSRGGYGLQRIIDRVPTITKPIIGFSDITALHNKAAICGAPSLHSIMCKHIATLPEDSEPIVMLKKALAGEPLEYTIPAHPLNRLGETTAPIIGGNLSVLQGLEGTFYGYSFAIKQMVNRYLRDIEADEFANPILLIEDIGERHYHIDRMMRHLQMEGALINLSGLIVGQFSDCEDDPGMNETVYETIKEAVAQYDYPVIFNAPFGHVEHNLPLWLSRPTQMIVSSEGAVLRI